MEGAGDGRDAGCMTTQTIRRLYAINEEIPLAFAVNMKQFAIEGYAVSALDFILKPVNITGEMQKEAADRMGGFIAQVL